MTTASCVCIDGDNRVFEDIFTVSVYPEESVHQLKERIKQALTPALNHIPASDLSLWKLATPLCLEGNSMEITKKLADIVFPDPDSNADQEESVQGLFPLHKILHYWPNVSDLLPTEHLHFLARLPPVDPFPSINPLKRKYDESAGGRCLHWPKHSAKSGTTDEYLLDDTSALNKLFKALWGRGSDDSIKEISSELVPDVYETSVDATATTAVLYNLSKVTGGDSFPLYNRFLVRDEYVELFKHITASSKSESHLLLGQPGIGKSIYLTYHLVQRLLAGQATIFSFNPHDRYLFHQSGVYDIPGNLVRTLWRINPKFNEGAPLVLVDFNAGQTQSDLAVFRSNPILAASSPDRARYKTWLKESNAAPYVMKTWEWNEIFQAQKILSARYDYRTDELRECFLKYGGCARLLLRETPMAIEYQIAIAIKRCPDIRKLVGKQDSIPEDESALIRVEPDVNSDGSIDRRFMYCEVISQHVFNQLMRARRSVIVDAFREISNLFQGQTPSGYVFEVHGHNAIL